MSNSPWQVHKFGGSSLADAACFQRVAEILLSTDSHPQVAVVSAMGGMTDALLALILTAERAGKDIEVGLEALSKRYTETCHALLADESEAARVLEAFTRDVQDARDVLQAISLVRSAADRSRDLVAGFGGALVFPPAGSLPGPGSAQSAPDRSGSLARRTSTYCRRAW